jgi:hypothetical protein
LKSILLKIFSFNLKFKSLKSKRALPLEVIIPNEVSFKKILAQLLQPLPPKLDIRQRKTKILPGFGGNSGSLKDLSVPDFTNLKSGIVIASSNLGGIFAANEVTQKRIVINNNKIFDSFSKGIFYFLK